MYSILSLASCIVPSANTALLNLLRACSNDSPDLILILVNVKTPPNTLIKYFLQVQSHYHQEYENAHVQNGCNPHRC